MTSFSVCETLLDFLSLSLSLARARALSPSPSLSLSVSVMCMYFMHACQHACTHPVLHRQSLPFNDPDTEHPRTELKVWQEKRAESRHLWRRASVAPVKRQRVTPI